MGKNMEDQMGIGVIGVIGTLNPGPKNFLTLSPKRGI